MDTQLAPDKSHREEGQSMMEEWEHLNATCQLMSKALSHMNTAKVEIFGGDFCVYVCVDSSRSHKTHYTTPSLTPAISVWENFQSVYTQLFLLITSLFYFSLKLSQTTNKVV